MISTRKWALVLFLALSCLRYSNAQEISTTGNLVIPTTSTSGSTWTNAVYQESLTCWAPGGPGYCGPNPMVGPTNSINYSWGWTDIYQQQNIGNLLPNSGTGLVVTGYNFGFTAKNGNGWDDGRTDLLFAYTQFNSPNGSTLFNHTHNLSSQFNWTNFLYSPNFTTPYRTAEIGSVRYGFVGADNNGWAGPYGPEIMNISFSLKYMPDPCITNPLSSPTCPGFSAALASRTTAPAVVSETPVVAESPVVAAASTTSSTLIAPLAPATASTAQPPALVSPRLQNIIRAVNEATTATVTATVQQSIQGSVAAQEAADQQASRSRDEGQQAAVASITAGPTKSTAEAAAESPAAGFTRPGDPAMAARGIVPVIPQEPAIEPKAQPRNTQPPAELAGGPSVTAFQAGVDITAYTNVALRDAAFYAPREIYRGQQNVDNRTVLRGLGSDARHQEMVDQQYRR